MELRYDESSEEVRKAIAQIKYMSLAKRKSVDSLKIITSLTSKQKERRVSITEKLKGRKEGEQQSRWRTDTQKILETNLIDFKVSQSAEKRDPFQDLQSSTRVHKTESSTDTRPLNEKEKYKLKSRHTVKGKDRSWEPTKLEGESNVTVALDNQVTTCIVKEEKTRENNRRRPGLKHLATGSPLVTPRNTLEWRTKPYTRQIHDLQLKSFSKTLTNKPILKPREHTTSDIDWHTTSFIKSHFSLDIEKRKSMTNPLHWSVPCQSFQHEPALPLITIKKMTLFLKQTV